MKKNGLIKSVLLRLKPYFNKRFLLAVSGGIDSMVMLAIFNSIKKEYDLSFEVLHVNHNVRSDSFASAEIVRKFCNELQVPFVLKNIRFETEKPSEELMRTKRYEVFFKTASERKADFIATAHTLNDSVETFIFNLIRGTGIIGALGIPFRRGKVLRPLIFTPRDEIVAFAEENRVPFYYDKTNDDLAFSRNRIRKIVIPELLKINPKATVHIFEFMEILKEHQKFLETVLNELILNSKKDEDKIVVNLKLLDDSKFFLFPDLIAKLTGITLSREKRKQIMSLLSTFHGSRSLAIDGFILHRSYETLEIYYSKKVFEQKKGYEILIEDFGKYRIPGVGEVDVLRVESKGDVFLKTNDACYFDENEVNFPFVLRNWLPGDKILPFGMKGRKKVSDIFTDRKIDRAKRAQFPVLLKNGEIVWIPGVVRSNLYRVKRGARFLIKFKFEFEN